MGAPRILPRDEESAASNNAKEEDDSPSAKRFKSDRFPLTKGEFVVFFGVFLIFSTGLFCIYITMPTAEYGKLKVPRILSDLRLFKRGSRTNPENFLEEKHPKFDAILS